MSVCLFVLSFVCLFILSPFQVLSSDTGKYWYGQSPEGAGGREGTCHRTLQGPDTAIVWKPFAEARKENTQHEVRVYPLVRLRSSGLVAGTLLTEPSSWPVLCVLVCMCVCTRVLARSLLGMLYVGYSPEFFPSITVTDFYFRQKVYW